MSSGGKISRKIKQGKVEIDYEDSALLVHYELEMVPLFFFAQRLYIYLKQHFICIISSICYRFNLMKMD
jgi:hypothetical protein